ncbi:MAG: MarR family winged helix-turn-helix transcriptional regulator [Solirubrobacteraceae bacterium]
MKIAPGPASESADPLEYAAGRESCSPAPARCEAELRGRAAIVGEEQALSECELRAWRGLVRAHASLAKLLDAELESEHGMPLTSYEVLSTLDGADRGRMRMCDLADLAQMSRSGLTRLVDRLEREGLLERCSCAHDARGAYACITAEGRGRLVAARGTHRAVVREHFLARFSEAELAALAGLWDRVTPCC